MPSNYDVQESSRRSVAAPTKQNFRGDPLPTVIGVHRARSRRERPAPSSAESAKNLSQKSRSSIIDSDGSLSEPTAEVFD